MAMSVHKSVHLKNLGEIQMIKDPIIDEVRRHRQEYAKDNNNDLDRIIKSLRKKEKKSKRKRLNPGPKSKLGQTGS